jgi:hypothetical protein
MILASWKFVRAVPEEWFPSAVKKDDVKIIKMFYDIPATFYGMVLYHTILRRDTFHTGSKKQGLSSFIFSLFDAPFTVSTVLVINHSTIHIIVPTSHNIPYHQPHLHNHKDFYACLIDGHYDILLPNGDYKTDISDKYFWPQAADWEAAAEMRFKDRT